MFGGKNGNTTVPVFLDENRVQYPTNISNQLQLFGNVPAGCNADPSYVLGREHNSAMFRPNKRGREAETISRQQRLQFSLNQNTCNDEADQVASIPIQNPVSTGLRLSYDDDERNSSLTSGSGSMAASPPILSCLGDNLRNELERQEEEFNHYIKIQEENLLQGVRDIRQRQMVSVMKAIEKSVGKKLHEKDSEIENINRKNRELMEKIKQVADDAQNWHYRAKYNESLVNILKTNLQQTISQGAAQMKEGFGDSDLDDTASYINPMNFIGVPGVPGRTTSVKNGMVVSCPVCQSTKTAGVQVYLS
ncbi:E3 ubiquitin-protein ligase BOI [Heracleum sosnowskyi]|uniref:E3 ubiquitin-protein ligase BOI n=1 Tax=Heracleum sosnowskyi TaxID=360622 RepID=A0AAD8I2V0_9APIA|nr:E3 ubiquitin-protein ligase BOI [Heracleum sosnowskyi]